MAARITQSVVEVLTVQPGEARITQSVVETLVGLGISCASLPHGMGGQPYTYTFPVGSGDSAWPEPRSGNGDRLGHPYHVGYLYVYGLGHRFHDEHGRLRCYLHRH